MFPPSFITSTLRESSIKCAMSVFPVWFTSKAGPVPSFEIANRSVKVMLVSMVRTSPSILRSPDISKLEVYTVLLARIEWVNMLELT